MDNTPAPMDLSACITYAPSTGPYIDPVKLLQLVNRRAILLAERTATPRLNATETELLRGHRLEALALKAQLEKVIKNAP